MGINKPGRLSRLWITGSSHLARLLMRPILLLVVLVFCSANVYAFTIDFGLEFQDTGLDPISFTNEDTNNNGVLDPGEDLNGNGFLDMVWTFGAFSAGGATLEEGTTLTALSNDNYNALDLSDLTITANESGAPFELYTYNKFGSSGPEGDIRGDLWLEGHFLLTGGTAPPWEVNLSGKADTIEVGPLSAQNEINFDKHSKIDYVGAPPHKLELKLSGFFKTEGDKLVMEHSGKVAIVPEPTTITLLGLGLAGLGFINRRKKH